MFVDDEETAQMIVDNDVYVVPTFCPYEEAAHYDPGSDPDKTGRIMWIKLEYYKDALQAGRGIKTANVNWDMVQVIWFYYTQN